MTECTLYLLTDPWGCTGSPRQLTWSPFIAHTAEPTEPIAAYRADNPHVPYLLDPVYDRYGKKARPWGVDAAWQRSTGLHRVTALEATTREELPRPAWVGTEADARVRVRFALLAARLTVPFAEARRKLSDLSLEGAGTALEELEELGRDCHNNGLVPQAFWMAIKAVRAYFADNAGGNLVDMVVAPYDVTAFYAAMAGTWAAVELDDVAAEAVALEFGVETAARPVKRRPTTSRVPPRDLIRLPETDYTRQTRDLGSSMWVS